MDLRFIAPLAGTEKSVGYIGIGGAGVGWGASTLHSYRSGWFSLSRSKSSCGISSLGTTTSFSRSSDAATLSSVGCVGKGWSCVVAGGEAGEDQFTFVGWISRSDEVWCKVRKSKRGDWWCMWRLRWVYIRGGDSQRCKGGISGIAVFEFFFSKTTIPLLHP